MKHGLLTMSQDVAEWRLKANLSDARNELLRQHYSMAYTYLRIALGYANKLKDNARKGLILAAMAGCRRAIKASA